MEPIKIGSIVPAEKLHHMIEEYSLNKEVNINYEDYNDRYIYSFIPDKKKSNNEEELYNVLAKFVQEIILKHYSKDFIRKRILKSKKYIEFKNNHTVELAYKTVINDKKLKKEKIDMRKEVLDYIIENKNIIIDGYLIFRSKSFHNIIDRAIDETIKDIQIELEYDKFIYILKQYVETQPSQINGVNVIIKEKEFEIRDLNNIMINNDFIILTLKELFDDDINQADVLINTLLALMPLEIKVHIEYGKEENLLDILKRIFENRLNICHGCSMCYKNIKSNWIDKS